MHDQFTPSTRCFQLGLAALWLVGCSSEPTPSDGTGGTPSTGGTTSTGGMTAAGTGGTTAGRGQGGAGGVGGSGGAGGSVGGAGATQGGGAGAGASSGAGGSLGGTAGTGGSGAGIGGAASSGAAGAASGAGGAAAGAGGAAGGAGAPQAGAGGAAGGGAGSAGSAGSGGFTPPTGENSIAYIGCSMAWNIGTGYKRVGGKVMWNSDSYQTSAMVVQNWTSPSSSSWNLFDQKMNSIGGKDTVKAIMIQICIFSSRATETELKAMITSARQHVNPGTHIYIVGQPQYQAGHECTLAGTGGAQWTDDQAKALAADSSINQDLTYLGQFKLDSSKNEVMSDTCHASSPTGENVLGEQAKVFFGG
jgi:hypothetical protein